MLEIKYLNLNLIFYKEKPVILTIVEQASFKLSLSTLLNFHYEGSTLLNFQWAYFEISLLIIKKKKKTKSCSN